MNYFTRHWIFSYSNSARNWMFPEGIEFKFYETSIGSFQFHFHWKWDCLGRSLWSLSSPLEEHIQSRRLFLLTEVSSSIWTCRWESYPNDLDILSTWTFGPTRLWYSCTFELFREPMNSISSIRTKLISIESRFGIWISNLAPNPTNWIKESSKGIEVISDIKIWWWGP